MKTYKYKKSGKKKNTYKNYLKKHFCKKKNTYKNYLKKKGGGNADPPSDCNITTTNLDLVGSQDKYLSKIYTIGSDPNALSDKCIQWIKEKMEDLKKIIGDSERYKSKLFPDNDYNSFFDYDKNIITNADLIFKFQLLMGKIQNLRLTNTKTAMRIFFISDLLNFFN